MSDRFPKVVDISSSCCNPHTQRSLCCSLDNIGICERDANDVSVSDSAGVPIRTDDLGNVFANINRQFIGLHETFTFQEGGGTSVSTTHDISQVYNWIFYISHQGPIILVLEVSVDGTNFFGVQGEILQTAPGTIILPSIDRPANSANQANTGFPLPGKSTRLSIATGTSQTVQVGFAAWK